MPKGQSAPKQNAIARFFAETIGELRKVTWPTWEEGLRLTGIVLATLFVSGTFLGVVDFLLTELFKLLLG